MSETRSSGSQRRIAREPSPVWDIELDLNESPSPETGPLPQRSPSLPTGESAVPINGAQKRPPPSPVWDIELDLNEDEVEEHATARKRVRGDDAFGAPSLL